ncbi:hypothetical protein J4Q44_G00178850 [Coregonus suidteri]|uniref:Integrase catalytic domain-containing protein n=1 Tax=Coregonus suidteri TaxID=861788 RepID=A0AAN8LWK9_9TELE
MIGVNLIGPFTKSRNGNSWCLTATDHFTKWVEAKPIKFSKGRDETGEATSKVMMDIFNTHGSPEVILSDRERWNTNGLVNGPTRPLMSTRKGAGETEGELPELGNHLLRVTSVEANNILQLEQLDGRPLKALTPYTSVKPNRQRPSTVRAPQRVSHPPEPVSLDRSDSLCPELEGDQLEDLGVLTNTQTWIHLMSSITNPPPTFHYISYSYCYYHVVIIC